MFYQRKYFSIEYGHIRFIDSLRFMNMPLAKLAKTLLDVEFQKTKKKHLVIDGSLY